MATRRDQDLPSHPSTSPGGRPRIPEREITTTDVTQHASEILTDQDFVITSPSEGDYFRHDGNDWVNVSGLPEADVTVHQAALAIAYSQMTGNIPEAQVTQHQAALAIAYSQMTGNIPEAQVTQHQAALAIGASQVTAGTFQDGLYVFSRSQDEILHLNHTNAAGDPQITFNQNGTQGGRILYDDSRNVMEIVPNLTNGGVLLWTKDSGGTFRRTLEAQASSPRVRIGENTVGAAIGLQVDEGDIVAGGGDVIATV